MTPLDATTFVTTILDATGLELPFTFAPPASVMVTVPPPAVAGFAPSVRSEEKTLAGITWYNKIFFKVFGLAAWIEAIVGKPASINAWLTGANTVSGPAAFSAPETLVPLASALVTAATR